MTSQRTDGNESGNPAGFFPRFLPVAGGLALLAGLLSALLLRNGLLVNTDSWGYWEGSVSLLETGQYAYLGGEPMVSWPPFFSLFLAPFLVAGGMRVSGLIVALCVLSAGNVLAWCAFLHALFRGASGRAARWALAGAGLYAALFLALHAVLIAHVLLLLFVGLACAVVLHMCEPTAPRRYLAQALLLSLLLSAALLTHNAAVAFVGAVCLTLLLQPGQPPRTRLAGALLAGASIFPWTVVRACLHQLHSHPPSQSMYTAPEYLTQLLHGFGALFLGQSPRMVLPAFALGFVFVLAAVCLLVFRRSLGLPARSLAALQLTLLTCGFLFAVFNCTRINSLLGGRFIWFVALTAPPVLLLAAVRRPAVLGALLACLIVPVLGEDIKRIAHPQVTPLPPGTLLAWDDAIRPDYCLTTRPAAPCGGAGVRIFPPTYPWMKRWLESTEPESARMLVRLFPRGLPEPATVAGTPAEAEALDREGLRHQQQGRYAQAETAFARAWEIREAALGPEHLQAACSLDRLAQLCLAQQRPAEARPLLLRALAIRERTLWNHPAIVPNLLCLARLEHVCHRDALATEYERRAAAVRTPVH